MESTKADYVKVGFFIVISILILWFGYIWISSQKRISHNFYYFIKLPRATLISNGTRVLVRGVPSGEVLKIELISNGVLVKVGIRNFKLNKGAFAQIVTPSALGTRMIDINPGDGPYLKMNDTIIGYDSPTFDQILSSVQGLSSRLDSVLNNVSILVINTNNSVKNLNNDVRNSISKINYILSEVSLLIEHQSNNLDTIAVNVNRTINLSQQTLKSLDSLINLAKTEIDSLKYRGTIGKLSQSDSLYIEIKSSILKIQELIDDIKKNPSKYINLKIF